MALCTSLALLTLSWVVSVPTAQGPVALRGLRTAPAAEAQTDQAVQQPVAGTPAPQGAKAKVAPASADAPASVDARDDQGGVDAALSTGDLRAALELARAARLADPSAENWANEARVLEQKGEWVPAISAYREAANRSDEIASVVYEDRIAELDAPARGTVQDEPHSKYRESLDEARAARELAANPPPPKADPQPVVQPAPREKIVTKWYFWVTVAAIAASAGAITGIAIKSAVNEKDRAAPAPSTGPGATMFRF